MLVEFRSSRSFKRELRDFYLGSVVRTNAGCERFNLCIASLEAEVEETTNAVLSTSWRVVQNKAEAMRRRFSVGHADKDKRTTYPLHFPVSCSMIALQDSISPNLDAQRSRSSSVVSGMKPRM